MKDSSWCQLTDKATKALSTGVAPVQNPSEPANCFNAADKIVPCVAVIDQDRDSALYSSDNEEEWQEFRSNYPERPFCLLMPNRSDSYSVPIRVDALNNKEFRLHTANWTSDDDPHDVDDWFSLCDLDQYGQDMKFIGLYIDGKDYGLAGMHKKGVKKSYNKFVSHAAAAGIKICEEYDDAKDWIKPFVGSLSPNVYSF